MSRVDLRQSAEYGKFMKSMRWRVKEGMFIKKLGLLPCSFIKYQRPSWPIDFKKIEKITREHRAIGIKIEPNILKDKKIEKVFEKYGYKKDKSPMLPTKTVWLDLKKSEKQLLKEMHYKTRYNIRKARELRVEAIRGDKVDEKQLKEFYEVYKRSAKRQRFWGLGFKQLKSLLKCFGEKGYLLIAKDKQLLGGLMMLVHDRVAYYSHNAATDQGRKKFGPTALVWQAIKLAKKLNCERFDFEGITDERLPVTKKWQGFSRFKKSFGGNVIEYMGGFSKISLKGGI